MGKQRGGGREETDCKHFTKRVQGDLTEKATIEEKGREPCGYSERERGQRPWGRSCCLPACFPSVSDGETQEAQAVRVFRNTSDELSLSPHSFFMLHHP